MEWLLSCIYYATLSHFPFCSSPVFLSLPVSLSSSTGNVEDSFEGFRNFSTFSSPARYSAAVLSSAAATVSAVIAAKTR